jgi:hypothetical protein
VLLTRAASGDHIPRHQITPLPGIQWLQRLPIRLRVNGEWKNIHDVWDSPEPRYHPQVCGRGVPSD